MTRLDLLNDFLVFAEYLNFTKTAEVLHQTQPGLSKRIASLEREVGAQLVDRDTRPPSLTPIGQVFLRGIRHIVDDYNDLLEEMERLRKVKPSALRIVVDTSYRPDSDLLRSAIIQLQQRRPLLTLDVLIDLPMSRIEALENALVDVAMVPYLDSLDLEARGYASVPIHKDPLVAIVPREHPLAVRQSIEASALAGERVLAPIRPFFDEWDALLRGLFFRHGVDVVLTRRDWRMGDAGSFFAFDFSHHVCIIASENLSLIPLPLADQYSVLRFSDPDFVLDYRLVYKRERWDDDLAVFLETYSQLNDQAVQRRTARAEGLARQGLLPLP